MAVRHETKGLSLIGEGPVWYAQGDRGRSLAPRSIGCAEPGASSLLARGHVFGSERDKVFRMDRLVLTRGMGFGQAKNIFCITL